MTIYLMNAAAFVVGILLGFWWRHRTDESERAIMKRITAQLDEINARAKAERDALVPNDRKAPE